jgi:sigma-B regulation protein RsbU (phosphoserine phosphatase)
MQRRILSAQLARSGYQVIEASSVEEALSICARTEPDMVISDWMMPGLTGIDFCREFRAMERAGYGYFILLTSKSDATDVARGLEMGADDFLSKPVNGDELRARLSAGDRILRMERELQEKNRLLRAAQEAIDRDLVEARKLQQSLVRERFRSFGTASVSLMLRPSGHVGGDLVGFFPIHAGRVALFGIDVSGHGITSALMTARLAGYLSGASPEQNIALIRTGPDSYDARPPAELASFLNTMMLQEMRTDTYFTLIYADVDLATGQVELLQAGHPHPAVLRRDGRVDYIGDGGLPIGLIEGARYETRRLTLAPGERLMLMSDGFTEAEGAGAGLLGEDGLAAIMERSARLRGPAFLDALTWDIDAHSGGELADDISAVLLEFDGPAG